MKLEDQVCSLELAKRLQEFGVQQDSHFCWYACENPLYGIMCEGDVTGWVFGEYKIADKGGADWIYSAFTVAELGEMLPLWWDSGKREDKDYICRVFEKNVTNTHHSFGSSEADARAKMLIYLIENGLIKEQDDATCQRKEGEEQERI